MTIAVVARAWHHIGVSTIPILPNASKRPLVRWAEYQARLPFDGELSDWWSNGQEYGIALIMGKVSGGAEMTELEGRACDGATFSAIQAACEDLGIADVWTMFNGPYGYSEMSPSGGLHFIYRVSDHDVPGNEKIANDPTGLVLAETRGEGGYVIVAPSSGMCHPSGDGWVKLSGEYGALPTVTWEQRCLFHLAIRRAFGYDDTTAALAPSSAFREGSQDAAVQLPRQPTNQPSLPEGRTAVEEVRPGDLFEQTVDWGDPLLLGGAGWTLAFQHGPTRHWTRPGKSVRDGASATTGHAGDRDRLFVFSTSTEFPTEEPITKFRAYSLLHHGGDDRSAAQQLVRLGFKTPAISVPKDLADFQPDESIEAINNFYELTDLGNGQRLAKYMDKRFKWVPELKQWFVWTGTCWERDLEDKATWTAGEMTSQMIASSDETLRKWGRKSQSARALRASVDLARMQPGMSCTAERFDVQPLLLNLKNGTLDLESGVLREHDRTHLITKTFNAKYDPEAACPNFHRFISQVLPDPHIRAYVQRAIGSTLIGKVDQRALMLIHGPSGTGKTQFTELMRFLFGGYGVTAPPSTFRSKRDGAPSNDLHRLRGARFVATSETADSAAFDEELIKRITGGDAMNTRGLYQEYVEWIPEATIWIATNFPPKFNSDDDAIWKRAKLIPFVTRFGEDGAPPVIPDFARTLLFPEADGILNWILEGLREFLANGIQEPTTVHVAATDLRNEVDPVCRFLEERSADGILILESQERIKVLELYTMYQEWARQSGERYLGRRRFLNRLEGNADFSKTRINGCYFVIGIGRASHASILGSFSQARFGD